MDELEDIFSEVEDLQPDDLEDIQEDRHDHFNQYTKLFSANHQMEQKILDLKRERDRLQNQLVELKKEYGSHKRNRRAAKDIDRPFICNICQKAYGSETSLKTHIRIKHSERDFNTKDDL